MAVFYLHFNRIAMQRKDPKVWSIQTSKGCFHAEHVICAVPLKTVNRPLKRTNPRYFLKGQGMGEWVQFKGDTHETFVLSSLASRILHTRHQTSNVACSSELHLRYMLRD